MWRWAFLALAFASSGFIFCAESDLKPDEVVRFRYQATNGTVFEGLGVCSLNADSVDCWDMDGKRSAKLTEQVKAQFMATSEMINIRFGKKNRMLVVKATSGANYSLDVSADRAAALQRLYSSGANELHMIGIATDVRTSELGVLLSIFGELPYSRVDIPFKEGARGSLDGVTYEVGKWSPCKDSDPPNRFYRPEGQKTWKIVLGVSGSDPNSGSVSYLPHFSDDRLTRYVDLAGNPISDRKALEQMATTPDRKGGPKAPKYTYLWIQDSSPGLYGGGRVLVSNVDPARIRSLTISVAKVKRVLITGFPLDPKD